MPTSSVALDVYKRQGVQFTGMVGVIVINFCTVVIALVLETAACACLLYTSRCV